MTAVEPGQCREHLGRLLGEELSYLQLLEQQLAHEHRLLSDNDVEGLEAAGQDRQRCVGQLLRIEDERRTLCRMLGQPATMQGIEVLLRWCDPQSTLLAQLGESLTLAGRCREQNNRNGLLVNARLHSVSNMLSMLDSPDASRGLYGRGRGGSTSVGHAGRLISANA